MSRTKRNRLQSRRARLSFFGTATVCVSLCASVFADEPVAPQPVAPVSSAPIQAQDGPATGKKSFVLTNLGAICEGTLQDRGNSYLIEFEGGGSVSVSKLDALYVGSTRESIYQYKLSHTRTEDVNETLKLADWASRRQLGAEAIKTLETRLSQSNDDAERRALQKKIDELRQAETARVNAERAVAQRDWNEEARQARQTRESKLDPQDAELEAWGQKVPFKSLDRFSRKAQPILQKRCGKSGCHAQGSDSQFDVRPKAVGPAARLALFYNMRETLDYVDFDAFEQSPIFNHPEVTNANGERVYPFGSDRTSVKDCESFVEWLKSLPSDTVLVNHARETRRDVGAPVVRQGGASRYDVVQKGPNAPQNASAPLDVTAQGTPDSFADLYGGASENASPKSNELPDDVIRLGVSQEGLRNLPNPEDDPNSTESVLIRAGQRPKVKYRDAYDPAIFNDRYHANRQ